jgi:hypothetical protein
VLQESKTKQHGDADAWAKQKVLNVDFLLGLSHGSESKPLGVMPV